MEEFFTTEVAIGIMAILAFFLFLVLMRVRTFSEKNKENCLKRKQNQLLCEYFVSKMPSEELKSISKSLREDFTRLDICNAQNTTPCNELKKIKDNLYFYQIIANICDKELGKRGK